MAIEGQLEVTVAEIPGERKELVMEEGSTVQDAINQAGFDASGRAVRMNSRDASGDDRVTDNALIALGKRAAGA